MKFNIEKNNNVTITDRVKELRIIQMMSITLSMTMITVTGLNGRTD